MALKYAFPLDEDELFESDYVRRASRADEDHTLCDFDVSMNTVHTYRLGRADKIGTHLKRAGQLFNVALVVYHEQREFVLGNAQLPVEDLLNQVSDWEQQRVSYARRADRAELRRVLFLYGTSYSQRENCIIGKVELVVNYRA